MLITDQIMRSSRSIDNNIAEGHGRLLPRQYPFLYNGTRFMVRNT
ncbi:four helix bundle protein [Mucilaginibacter panaciglaebae]